MREVTIFSVSNTGSRVKRQVQADRNMFMKTTRGWTDIRQEQLDTSHLGRPDLKEVLDVGYVNRTIDPSLNRRGRGIFENMYDVMRRLVEL